MRESIAEVLQTIAIAVLLVVLVIFAFLRDWRTTLVPVLVIPVSLVGAFFLMYLFGFSINVLSLLGIVLAIGLGVDDAIVVTENIYAKIEQGLPADRLASAPGHRCRCSCTSDDPRNFSSPSPSSLMRGIPTLPVLLLGGLLLGGCSPFGTDENGADRLVGPTWRLTALRAPDGTTTPVDSLIGQPDSSAAYTLEFREDDQLGGVADCNIYGGDYAARDDGALSVDMLVSTEQYCGEASREPLYLDALSSADAYEVDDEGLRIRFEGEGLLWFDRGAGP